MKKILSILLGLAPLILSSCTDKTARDYPVTGIGFVHVHFSGGLLAERVGVVRENTIPFAFRKCEETGRIANFARAAGLDKTPFQGIRYDDSDVYKVMEAAAYSLSTKQDPALDHYMDSLITLIGAAQEPDGYLFTIRTAGGIDVDEKAGKERWSNIFYSHELYNVGHMYEAAVAHYYATGKTSFLDIARKNADLIYDTFYVPRRPIISGHEEIELALVKLYRATHDVRYLDLSRYLLECRGNGGERGTYMQDHQPVREQREAVGHAVRAGYLYMAMTDIAAIEDDAAYKEAIQGIWNDVNGKKLYLTGGLGAHLKGEGFGKPYYLPSATAYCETCAAIANCMWNYRMFCLSGDARYFDVLERSLYNNVLHGISDDGMRFFYPNVLECNEDSFAADLERQKNGKYSVFTERNPWFQTSCCPSNLARFILSLPGYTYAVAQNRIYVNLFESGESEFKTAEGKTVRISQDTGYPYSGTVRLKLEQAPAGKTALLVRIPEWSQGKPVPTDLYAYTDETSVQPVLKVNGAEVPVVLEKGYAVVERKWKDGDDLELILDMPVRKVKANPQVEDTRGKLALERGPFVYCTLLPENDETNIRSLVIGDKDTFRINETAGIVTLTDTDRNLEFIPYYRHAQEGKTQMGIFLKELNP